MKKIMVIKIKKIKKTADSDINGDDYFIHAVRQGMLINIFNRKM